MERSQIVGSIILTLMAAFSEAAINGFPLRQEANSLSKMVRGPLRKTQPSSLLGIWISGVGLGMATFTTPVAQPFFWLSYSLIIAATVWAVGMFLVSPFLENKKVDHKGGSSYKAWKYSIPLVLLAFSAYLVSVIRTQQVMQELSELHGVLMPADDPLPSEPQCAKQHPDDLTIIFGTGLAVHAKTLPLNAVALYDRKTQMVKPLIRMDKNAAGNVALTSEIRDRDNKLIARVTPDDFTVSQNKIFRTYHERPDKSTLVVQDEFGDEVLRVRYLNTHAIKMEGVLYYAAGEGPVIIKGEQSGTLHSKNVCIPTFGDTALAVDVTK
jgi:hypothetical protein